MLRAEFGITHALGVFLEVFSLDSDLFRQLRIGRNDGTKRGHQIFNLPLIQQHVLMDNHPACLLSLLVGKQFAGQFPEVLTGVPSSRTSEKPLRGLHTDRHGLNHQCSFEPVSLRADPWSLFHFAWGGTHSASAVRSAQVCGANPVGRSTMVMHPSTGQTSEHKLHPTHSVSSTRGIRSSDVANGPTRTLGGSSFGIGVTAILFRPGSWGFAWASTCPSTGPTTRSRAMHWCAP